MFKPSQSFKDLLVWKKAHLFVLHVYRYTKMFPNHEIYGLTSQFRRAAVSIAANIAEGFRKKGIKDKLKFYNIAQGSLEEAKYYCILSVDLDYGDSKELFSLSEEISKMLNAYIKSIVRNEKSVDSRQ